MHQEGLEAREMQLAQREEVLVLREKRLLELERREEQALMLERD